MIWSSILAGSVALVCGVACTLVVMPLARRWHAIDDPGVDPTRKRHANPTPLLGGWALIVAVLAVLWGMAVFFKSSPLLLPTKQLVGLSVAGLLLMIGGALDDRWRLSPRQQLVTPALATLAIMLSGIGIDVIRNPFGGMIHLDTIKWTIFTWDGVGYRLTLWSDLFTAAWLFITMYATKLLDGLDGLVTGVGAIGSIVVFLLTLRPEVNQPEIGALALVFGGACLGFLIFNWHPAKIFLGESGSLFVGFLLGTLAIISGAKLATALLILGLPIFDLVFVVLYRWLVLHQSPLRTADRTHLHFRLIDQGWGVRRTAIFLYSITGIFGFSTLFSHGITKVMILAALAAFMAGLLFLLLRRARRLGQTG